MRPSSLSCYESGFADLRWGRGLDARATRFAPSTRMRRAGMSSGCWRQSGGMGKVTGWAASWGSISSASGKGPDMTVYAVFTRARTDGRGQALVTTLRSSEQEKVLLLTGRCWAWSCSGPGPLLGVRDYRRPSRFANNMAASARVVGSSPRNSRAVHRGKAPSHPIKPEHDATATQPANQSVASISEYTVKPSGFSPAAAAAILTAWLRVTG